MVEKNHPQRGSMGFSPRKRASQPLARFRTWPDADTGPTVQGFTGIKAGMTHVMMVDYRPTSTTSGQEVREAVTVLETPPMGVAGVRVYRDTPYGLKADDEVWASTIDNEVNDRVNLSDKRVGSVDDFGRDRVDEVRLITHDKPYAVDAIGKKVPEITEIRVGGGLVDDRLDLAAEHLGQDLALTDVADTGQMLDVAGVTKGKGRQGAVKRWGVKMQSHKNSENRRDAHPLGPFQPRFIRPEVPLPGQTGYHQRTELNKRLLMIGDDPEEITPDGGFVGYGEVSGDFALLHGTIPGPSKRPISLRHALRYEKGVEVEEPNITYISTASKQGV
jgi:large subunit ribosomal protein L3